MADEAPGTIWIKPTSSATGFDSRLNFSSVVYDDKTWVIGGNFNGDGRLIWYPEVWYSSDGVSWIMSTESAPLRSGHSSVVFDDKIWIIGGENEESILVNDSWYSTDGVTWTQAAASAAFPARTGHTSVVFDNTIWVIGGSDATGKLNDVWYSTDGISWTESNTSAEFSARTGLVSVEYDNKMWVIGGTDQNDSLLNDVWYSTDGEKWAQATASAAFPGRNPQMCIVYQDKIWVIGDGVWSSADGITWTESVASGDLPTFEGQIATVSPDRSRMMVICPVWDSLITSTDGITWDAISTGYENEITPYRYGFSTVFYDDKVWVIGGIGGDEGSAGTEVWYSTDGENWTLETASAAFPARHYHTSVVFDNKMWVIGGERNSGGADCLNDVWYSTDGVTWILANASAAFPERTLHSSLVFDNKMWVIGGQKEIGGGMNPVPVNDTWYSTDGVIWTQATDTAAFPPRFDHTSVVYGNRMWVIGGTTWVKTTPYHTSSKMLNDVWYSTDGKTWTQTTSSAAFSARCWHASEVYKNSMWVISGLNANYEGLHDVWYSTDGINWLLANASSAVSAGDPLESVVSSDGKRIWVIGGPNSIWYSDNARTVSTAGFTVSNYSGLAPLDVQFTDTSIPGDEPITGYYWDFGDGTNSTEQNPSHTFTHLGGNRVILTITDAASWNSSSIITITVLPVPLPPPPLTAHFVMDTNYGYAPLVVYFTDFSKGEITGWTYDFGDGMSSHERNPVHSYTADTGGLFIYKPKLTVTNIDGNTSTYESPAAVSMYGPSPGAPVAGYNLTIISPSPQQPAVRVTDTSQRATYMSYYFGDSTEEQLNRNPIHYYPKPAFYRLTQSVTNTFGTRDKTSSLTFYATPPPTKPSDIVGAAFSVDYNLGDSPLKVQFFDHSWGNISNYSWSFGDGSTSFEKNPHHTYAGNLNTMNIYQPTLTVTDAYGAASAYTSQITVFAIPLVVPTTTPTPEPTTIPITKETTPTGTYTIVPTLTGDSGSHLVVQQSGVMVNGLPGANPELNQGYSIYITVYNPHDEPVSADLTLYEIPVKEYLNEIYSRRDTVAERITVPPHETHTYTLKYLHAWVWTESVTPPPNPHSSELSAIGIAMKVIFEKMGVDRVLSMTLQVWVGSYKTIIEAIRTSSTALNGIVGYMNPAEYRYNPSSAQIDGLASILVQIRVGEAKFSAFQISILSGFTATFLGISGVIATLASAGLGLLLMIGGVICTVISSTFLAIANDPDMSYTDPVIISHLDIPELDQIEDSPLKTYVNRMVPIADDSQGLLKSYAKYLGAQQAGDKVWETKLLKESYSYSSLLINDYEYLNESAGPAIQYLDEQGFHPTNEDVTNAAQSIQANGLPQKQVQLLKRMNYSDADIAEFANWSQYLPPCLVIEYNQSLFVLMDLQKEQIVEMNQQFATELGDNAPPYADFTVSTEYGTAPLTIEFNDASLRNASEFSWDFGDNSSIKTQSPTVFYIYTNPGNYTVTLTATSPTGSDTRVKYELIRVMPKMNPVANFTSNKTTGLNPLAVEFTDTSSNSPTSWEWDFGDNSTVTEQNPVHTYYQSGNYTVTLNATNADGMGTVTIPDYITVIPNPPVPNFTAAPLSGKAPLTVQFNDTSSGGIPTLRNWNFGDGTTSIEMDPVHTYTGSGNYTVSLELANGDADVFENRTDYITVLPLVLPVANFTASPTTGTAPLTVTFSDGSEHQVTAWSWDFGDGTTSQVQSPSHTYTTAGSYTVILNVTNNDGNASHVKPALITVNAPPTTVTTTIPTTQPTTKPTTRPTRQPLSPMTALAGIAIMSLVYATRKKK
jgi:PKD repeat protein